MKAHVCWKSGASLCGWTGITLPYDMWLKEPEWREHCERCKEHPSLPLLILEYYAQ